MIKRMDDEISLLQPCFKAVFNKGVSKVEDSESKLKLIAGGTTNGKKWYEDSGTEEILKCYEKTLEKVNCAALDTATKLVEKEPLDHPPIRSGICK